MEQPSTTELCVEYAILFGCPIIGRLIAAIVSRSSELKGWKSAIACWIGASLGAAVGFIAILIIFPPLVLDPAIVILILPFFAGAVGAVIEFVAQLVRLVRIKTERRQTLRNLGFILLAGLVCGFALFLGERLNRFPPPPAPILLSPDSESR